MGSKGVQMIKGDILCDRMINVCLKLQTLRDSCAGIFRTQTYPPNITWFDGAAAICQEAIEWIEEVVLILARTKIQILNDKGNDRCDPSEES